MLPNIRQHCWTVLLVDLICYIIRFLITFLFQSLESFSSFEFLCNFEIFFVFVLRNCVRIMLPGKLRIASTFLLNLHQPFKVTCVMFQKQLTSFTLGVSIVTNNKCLRYCFKVIERGVTISSVKHNSMQRVSWMRNSIKEKTSERGLLHSTITICNLLRYTLRLFPCFYSDFYFLTCTSFVTG